MRYWSGAMVVWLSGLGCMALPSRQAVPDPQLAQQLWERGQAAMKHGQPDQAIVLYEQSLVADPNLNRNHLSLAAAYLEKEDLPQACPHLAAYVEGNPERLTLRLRYAELLARLGRSTDACSQLEQGVEVGQNLGSASAADVIRCHGRLVELALEADDTYEEHLHRGIGLFLLARERANLPDADGALAAEGLLCKAAAELSMARQERPEEARPCWYLYEVWSKLGQRQPALCRLREAQDAGPFSYMTPTEQRRLLVALLDNDGQGRSKK